MTKSSASANVRAAYFASCHDIHKAPEGAAASRHHTTIPVLSGAGCSQDALAEAFRTETRQMLATAIEAELAAYIDNH